MRSTKFRKKLEAKMVAAEKDVQDEDATGNLDYDPVFIDDHNRKLRELTKKPWESTGKKRFGSGFRRT